MTWGETERALSKRMNSMNTSLNLAWRSLFFPILRDLSLLWKKSLQKLRRGQDKSVLRKQGFIMPQVAGNQCVRI